MEAAKADAHSPRADGREDLVRAETGAGGQEHRLRNLRDYTPTRGLHPHGIVDPSRDPPCVRRRVEAFARHEGPFIGPTF